MLTDTPIRILIVDDNLLILAATKTLLASCKYFTVVGESSNALTAIKMAAEMQPDVVLMDINMQPVDGIEATRRLLARCPDIVVIGFSALPYPHQEQQMIDAGATGVICKSATRQIICDSIVSYYQKNVMHREGRSE